jgi:hypothetical protein
MGKTLHGIERALPLGRGLLEARAQPRLLLFGAPARGDVAEARYASHRLPVQALGNGVAFEDAAVLELEDVQALHVRPRINRTHPGQELLGVPELVQNVREQRTVVARGQDLGGDPPELGESLVVGHHLALKVHDQHAVGGGF